MEEGDRGRARTQSDDSLNLITSKNVKSVMYEARTFNFCFFCEIEISIEAKT